MPQIPDLFAYQETGKAWLMEQTTAMLADQPGLGKTAQAIAAARDISAGHFNAKICVICPRSAVKNWHRELKRFWPGHTPDQDLVTTFERVANTQHPANAAFNKLDWDFIIIDEAHRLKTPDAQRTQAVYKRVYQLLNRWRGGLKPHPTRVWLLTGTPAKNHAGELYTHLAVLRPELIQDRSGRVMSQAQFEEKYCNVGFDKHGHRRIRGSKNITDLRAILDASGFFLRRLKKQVQPDLPPLIFDTYPLNFTGRVGGAPNLEHLEGWTIEDALNFLQENQSNLAQWQHDVASVKVPLVKEFLETELDTPGEKIICFYHHRILGEELKNLLALYQPVLVDGRTAEPQDQVDEFQNNPNCRLFLGQIQACGEALNITAATQVAFAEYSWSPSDNYQAACRAHRYGLQNTLITRFLYLDNSTDEIVARVVERKTAELAELFD